MSVSVEHEHRVSGLQRGLDHSDGEENRPLHFGHTTRGEGAAQWLGVETSLHERGDLLAQEDRRAVEPTLTSGEADVPGAFPKYGRTGHNDQVRSAFVAAFGREDQDVARAENPASASSSSRCSSVRPS